MKIYFKGAGKREQDKRCICELLKSHPSLDQVDIADKLSLTLKETCELCNELVEEKKIERVLGSKITKGILKARGALKHEKLLSDKKIFGKKGEKK